MSKKDNIENTKQIDKNETELSKRLFKIDNNNLVFFVDVQESESLTNLKCKIKEKHEDIFDNKLEYIIAYNTVQQYVNPNYFKFINSYNGREIKIIGNNSIQELETTENNEEQIIEDNSNKKEQIIEKDIDLVEEDKVIDFNDINVEEYSLDDFCKNSLLIYLNRILGNRNIYFRYHYRGSYINQFDYNIVSLINTPSLYDCNIEYLKRFVYAKIYDYFHSSFSSYSVKNSTKKIDYRNNYEMKTKKYYIEKIPSNILKLFNNIGNHIEEVKKILKLNNETGFYYYTTETNRKIPIICKHQMMHLEHVSVYDITNECYRNGVCKYCGMDLVNFNQSDNFVLSNFAVSLLIMFSECFKTSTLADDIIYETSQFIIAKLEKENISSYDDKVCYGYVCLYLIKLLTEIPNHFNVIKYRIKDLLNKLSFELATLGKNEKDIELILNDDTLIESVSELIERLKSINVSKVNDTSLLETIIEDVFFDSAKHEAKTELQKLYLEDPSKLYSLQLALEDIFNSFYNFEISLDFYKKFTANVNELDFKRSISSDGISFFKNTSSYFCPVNFTHNFEKGICSHCGLQKDNKNLTEIYNKYSKLILNVSTSKPITISEKLKNDFEVIRKQSEINSDNILNDLLTFESKLELKEILIHFITDYSQLQKIEKSISDMNPYVYDMCATLRINYDNCKEEIKKISLPTFVKRLFIYSIGTIYKNKKEIGVNYFITSYLTDFNPLDFIIVN